MIDSARVSPPPPGRAAVSIRDIAEPDRDAWSALFLAYGLFYETRFVPQVIDGVWAWLMDAESDICAVVATTGSETVGFAHYRRLPDTFTAGPSWFLDDLFVASEARGSGAGTALIEAVSERAASDGGGTLRWITAANNAPAQRLYESVATRTSWVTFERQT